MAPRESVVDMSVRHLQQGIAVSGKKVVLLTKKYGTTCALSEEA